VTDEPFERERVCYEQNCETFRGLNNIMWQVPVIAMTLTGGLWYGVGSMPLDAVVKRALLLFGAIGNVGLVLVIIRTRTVMGAYLKKIKEFAPAAFVEPPPSELFWLKDGGVRTTMSLLMLIGAFMSFLGFLFLPCIQQ